MVTYRLRTPRVAEKNQGGTRWQVRDATDEQEKHHFRMLKDSLSKGY